MVDNKQFVNLIDLEVNDGGFEDCTFANCRFVSADFSGIEFTDCSFENCVFTDINIANVSLRNVTFSDCKMQGVRFDMCRPFLFSVHFSDCQLDYSSFYKMNLKDSSFNSCRMVEVDLVESDLTDSLIKNCDLSGAVFDRTKMERCDIRESVNFTIDPESNNTKGINVDAGSLSGFLSEYGINIF